MSFIDRAGGARALVTVDAAAACPRCASGKGCGAGLFAAAGDARQVEATVPPGLRVAVDDAVEISLAPDNLLRAAALVYGVPLLGALAAAGVAFLLQLGDAMASLAALLGLALGLTIGRIRLQKTHCLRRFVPSVERLL